MNDEIIKLIKDARLLRGKTQKDLGDLLNKTPAAISDLERGKVQVTAEDLEKISRFLELPIEYFFGEVEKDKVLLDTTGYIRSLSKGERELIIDTAKSLKDLLELEREAKKYFAGQKVPEEMIAKGYKDLLILKKWLNKWSERIDTASDFFKKQLSKK